MKPREPRRRVVIPARMQQGSGWHDACILDISSRGMMLQAAMPPPRGTVFELRRGPFVILARVVWASQRRFGVRTQDELPVDQLIAGPTVANDRTPERRAAPRPVAVRHAASRQQGRRMEYMTALVMAAVAATLAWDAVQSAFSTPLATVEQTLSARAIAR